VETSLGIRTLWGGNKSGICAIVDNKLELCAQEAKKEEENLYFAARRFKKPFRMNERGKHVMPFPKGRENGGGAKKKRG